MPGKDNVVADALSRFAYPASSAREDVSFHGSSQACEEIQKIIEKELLEGRMVGHLILGGHDYNKGIHCVGYLSVAGTLW